MPPSVTSNELRKSNWSRVYWKTQNLHGQLPNDMEAPFGPSREVFQGDVRHKGHPQPASQTTWCTELASLVRRVGVESPFEGQKPSSDFPWADQSVWSPADVGHLVVLSLFFFRGADPLELVLYYRGLFEPAMGVYLDNIVARLMEHPVLAKDFFELLLKRIQGPGVLLLIVRVTTLEERMLLRRLLIHYLTGFLQAPTESKPKLPLAFSWDVAALMSGQISFATKRSGDCCVCLNHFDTPVAMEVHVTSNMVEHLMCQTCFTRVIADVPDEDPLKCPYCRQHIVDCVSLE